MSSYPRWRLEGRALEHGFARTPLPFIRMRDPGSKTWERVCDTKIRRAMDSIANSVRSGMAAHGIEVLGADCPCLLSEEQPSPKHSVDLRIRVGDVYAIVELKWSRYDLESACQSAKQSLPWMISAATKPGFFLLGGRRYKMKINAVGTVGVSLTCWRLHLDVLGTKKRVIDASGDSPGIRVS